MVTEVDGLRRRPSFRALATLARHLGDGELRACPPAPEGCYLYEFVRADGSRRVVAWTRDERQRIELGSRPAAAWTRDGDAIAPPTGTSVEVGGSPLYLAFD